MLQEVLRDQPSTFSRNTMVLWGRGNCQVAEVALLLLLPQIWTARDQSTVMGTP